MVRIPNQFYQDPTTIPPDPVDLGGAPAQQVRYRSPVGEMGSNLLTALFGDPQAAAQQRQMQEEAAARAAAAEEARAHARYYGTQADGQTVENAANTRLPELFANLYKTTPAMPARAPIGAESDDAGEIPAVPGVTAEQAFKAGLPALIASLVQGGHGANVGNVTQAAGAFADGDELARRGMVSDSHTPGKDFALTPERADQIASTDAAAKYMQAMGVARTNHSNDIPVANIRAGASRDVATINNRDDVTVAQIGANSRVDAAGVRGGGANRLGALIGSLYPGARLTSQDRTPREQQDLVDRGVTRADPAHTYHVPGHGGNGIDMAPIPGKSLANVVTDLTARGETVLEAKVEKGGPNDGTGPHWHIAIADRGGKPDAAPKGPKPITMAARDMLDAEIDRQIGSELRNKLSTAAITDIRARAATMYQQSGNPSDAVRKAVMQRVIAGHDRNARLARGTVAPAAAAPKVEQWGRDASGKLKRIS